MTLTSLVPNRMRESAESQIDRLFDDAFRHVDWYRTGWVPGCNAYEDDNGFTVQLALPGWDQKDIELTVEDGVLTVKGERKTETSQSAKTYHIKEMGWDTFSRSFTLPSYVEDRKASASFQQGLLSIHFPKCEEAKPRRITIEGR